MRKGLLLVTTTIAAAIGGYYFAVAQGLVAPDFRNPLQAAMIIKQTVEVEVPFIRPLPPEQNHLRVLVTYLDGDQDGAFSNRLYNAIHRHPLFETVLLYRPLRPGKTQNSADARARIAAELARKWKADVVVYGTRDGDNATLDFYSNAVRRPSRLLPYTFANTSLKLSGGQIDAQGPSVIAAILANPDVFLENGRFTIDALVSAANDLYAAPGRVLRQDVLPQLWAQLGYISAIIADAKGDSAWLEKAVAADRLALKAWTKENAPQYRARAQANLGIALSTLGERKGDAGLLMQATDAFQEALNEITREKAPHDWSIIQEARGEALYALGKQAGDILLLGQSLDALKLALTVQAGEQPRLEWWAPTQSNLGLVLFEFGRQTGDGVFLKQSVAVLDQVLKVQTRQNRPVEWAKSEETLALALCELGRQKRNVLLLGQGVDAFQKALTIVDQSHAPLDWARLQLNLGMALAARGQLEENAALLGEAADTYRKALRVLPRDNASTLWADAEYDLGMTLVDLYNQKHDAVLLRQAIDSFEGALTVYRERKQLAEAQQTEDNIATLKDVQQKLQT